MITKLILHCIVIHFFGLSSASKYNVSMGQLGTCKEYDLRGTGYTYTDFFHLNKLKNNVIAPNELIHLKFYVMTAMDAHILLSSIDRPGLMDRVYEIVIGAGGNTFSTIRVNKGRRRVATNQDPHLLSIFDPTPIEIVQRKDGNLLVYIPGFKEEPLLNYTDSLPLNINYLSFSTFGLISARWFYDCAFDGFENEIEQEARYLTPSQRLAEEIVKKSENQSVPANLERIRFGFHISWVSFQQKSAILRTRMDLTLAWQDPKLAWELSEFNGTDTLSGRDINIWKPNIILLNGALESVRHMRMSYDMQIHSNGSVTLMANNIELFTFCHNRGSNWPNEQVKCRLLMGVNEFAGSQLRLEYDDAADMLPSQVTVDAPTEWKFLSLFVTSVKEAATFRYRENGMQQIIDGDTLISFVIARNGGFYRNVFIMPAIVSQLLMALSFLLRGYRRGGILLVVFVILALGTMFITRHAPSSYEPKILIIYQWFMLIAVFLYMLHITVMWLELYPPAFTPPDCIMTIVNCNPLRLMLGMRFQDSKEYVDIQQYPWREFGKIVNNLLLLLSTITFILIDIFFLPQ